MWCIYHVSEVLKICSQQLCSLRICNFMHKQQLINSFKEDFKMLQKCPIWDKNFKNFLGRGFNPLPRPFPSGEGYTPSYAPPLLAPTAPRRPQPPSQKTLKEALVCVCMLLAEDCVALCYAWTDQHHLQLMMLWPLTSASVVTLRSTLCSLCRVNRSTSPRRRHVT